MAHLGARDADTAYAIAFDPDSDARCAILATLAAIFRGKPELLACP